MTEDTGTGADRPRPIVQTESAAYWDGARRRRLVLQRCRDCAIWIHPPRAICGVCQCAELVPTEASGSGSIFSYSVMHLRGVPGFDDQVPYAVVLVELAEQSGLLAVGHVVDCSPSELAVGMPVHVTFEDLGDVVLPQWKRADP